MLLKKLILLGLLTTITTPTIQAASTHEIRTMGLVTAGVFVTLGGVHILCRQNNGFANKIFDVITGLGLISAGITGIVMSGQISKEIENTFR